jgi:hypothetical protein
MEFEAQGPLQVMRGKVVTSPSCNAELALELWSRSGSKIRQEESHDKRIVSAFTLRGLAIR